MDMTLFIFLLLCCCMLGFIFIGGWRGLMFLATRLGRAFRGKK